MLRNSDCQLPSRVALVHEWFTPNSVGGAEQVVQTIDSFLRSLERSPQLFALVDGESRRSSSWLFQRKINTSFVQKMPWGVSHVQQYLPFLPFAIEQFDFSGYQLIISSSHLVAKGILISPDQLHVSYVHTPVRYAWDQMNIYLKRSIIAKRGFENLIRMQLHYLRIWDSVSGSRPNYLIANSRFTARRISRFWGRSSTVLHPPVDVERFKWNKPRDDIYLCVSRLVPNKRVDLVVKAFNQLRLPLVVIGEGPERDSLEKIAGPNIKILGFQSQEIVENYMESCKAFVYAGMEDFGISLVEAMASGAPVIALEKGGVLDTVRCITSDVASPTGLLFPHQTTKSLVDAVLWFEEKKLWRKFPPESLRQWAESFRPEKFTSRLHEILIYAWTQHLRGCDVVLSDPSQGFNSQIDF